MIVLPDQKIDIKDRLSDMEIKEYPLIEDIQIDTYKTQIIEDLLVLRKQLELTTDNSKSLFPKRFFDEDADSHVPQTILDNKQAWTFVKSPFIIQSKGITEQEKGVCFSSALESSN